LIVRVGSDLLLLLDLLHENCLLLVLAAFVLEPDADDTRTEAGHFDQLLLHEGVGSRIGRVARPQGVQLLLVENRADARRFAVRSASSGHSAAILAAAGSFTALLARRRYASVGAVCNQKTSNKLLIVVANWTR
jgi:hypothetical protein